MMNVSIAIFSLLLVPAAPAAATDSIGQGPTTRVAMPTLEARGVSPELADSIAQVVLSRLADIAHLEILGASDVQRLLDHEQQRQIIGCQEDSACLSELTGLLDVHLVLGGSLGQVGDRFVLTLVLLDTAQHKIIRRVSREATEMDNLLQATKDAADALFRDTDLPTEGCVGCGSEPSSVSETPWLALQLKFGNNFISFFKKGLSSSFFSPAFDLNLSGRITQSLLLGLSIGLTFGSSNVAAGEAAHFQVVPADLIATYIFDRFNDSFGSYAGLGLGVGIVRAAFSEGDNNIRAALNASLFGGLSWHFVDTWSLNVEASYRFTADTPSQLVKSPLGAAALRLGVAYGY